MFLTDKVNIHQVFKLRKRADWLDSSRIANLNFLSQHGLFCTTLVVSHVVVKAVWCFAKQAINRPLYHRWYNFALYNHVWTLPLFGIKKKKVSKREGYGLMGNLVSSTTKCLTSNIHKHARWGFTTSSSVASWRQCSRSQFRVIFITLHSISIKQNSLFLRPTFIPFVWLDFHSQFS